jgi:hypothetical protein
VSRSCARLLHIASFLVIGSGAIWAYLRYVHDLGPEPEDPVLAMEWSGVHPWEPSLRNLHLLAAPLLVFAVGLIWSGHVAPRLFRPWARRATGLSLALLFGPMVITGVLLQVAESEASRTLWAWAHGISSLVWAAAYLAHQLGSRRRHRSASGGAGAAPAAPSAGVDREPE